MTYLDRLEAELVRAAFREPRRVWPARTAVTLATAGAATALVLALFGGPPPAERTAESAPPVEASYLGTMFTEDDRELGLRIGVRADEPVTMEVTARAGTVPPARGSAGPAKGDVYVDLELPYDRGALELEVRVTDAVGNTRTFRPGPSAPVGAEDYAILRSARVSTQAPDLFFETVPLGPNPALHEAFNKPHTGTAWIAVGEQVCAALLFPADGGGDVCWDDLAAAATPKVDRQVRLRGLPAIIFAIVPDGVRSARVRTAFGGYQVPIINNLLAVAPRHPVLAVSYRTPDGERRVFPLG